MIKLCLYREDMFKKSYRLKSQCSMAKTLICGKFQVVQSIAMGMETVPSRRSM